jgi:hypothetical protein
MKIYIFSDKNFFKTNYDKYFAMQTFHRELPDGTLLVKFITKKVETYLRSVDFINKELKEYVEK